jgi:glycosyltransferase involved in cell wall biosynthesis
MGFSGTGWPPPSRGAHEPMGDPSRPLVIIVPLPPTYRGGTEEYAYRLARRFSDDGPVRIFTTTVDPTPDSPPLDTAGIPIVRMSARRVFQRPLVRRSALPELRRAVESAGLVQLHMPFPTIERKVVQWANAAKVPVVLTYHMDADLGGAGGAPGAGFVTAGYRRFSAHPALSGADAVVSNSLGYAAASPVLSQHMPKVRVIAKGVDLDRLGLRGPISGIRLDPGPDLLPGSDPKDRRVLFVGRMVPYKGLPFLLDAIANVAPSVPRLRLYLAGTGPERPALEAKVVRLGLQDTVTFLGFVPDQRLGELYRSADVVACPSVGTLESTATTLEEAASLGTPTLGSNLPGADETVPNDGIHGLLCPPGDVDALSRALDRLLGQPRPPPRAAPRTWDDTAQEYRKLFEELGYAPGGGHNLHNSPVG